MSSINGQYALSSQSSDSSAKDRTDLEEPILLACMSPEIVSVDLASKHQKHQMGGSMHMRRMEDGYMHRRVQKHKHMQGNDLDTPTEIAQTSRCP